MKTWQALGVLVAAASIGWMLIDSAEPTEPAPARRTADASRSAAVNVSRGEPRWQPRSQAHHALAPDEVAERDEPSGPPERKPVPLEDAQACQVSDTCADARACVDGQCVHCLVDSECETGMVCAQSRCIVADDVDCVVDEDCGADGHCVTDVRVEGPARARYFSYCGNEHQHDDAIATATEETPPDPRALAAEAHALERAELFARAGFGQVPNE